MVLRHEYDDDTARRQAAAWWQQRMAQQRTCARCGRYVVFYPDEPSGDWYRCSACGAAA